MGKKAKYSKSHKRGFFDYVGIYLKGACMGAADVVPGVSGGTIALILRVYVELVDSLKAIFSKDLLHIVRRGGFRQYWQAIHGGFLLALLAGIVSAILLLAGVILHLVEHYPVRVWSFFFGLVVASIFLVLWRISKWRWFTPIFVILGIVAGYFIVTSPVVSMPDTTLYYFLSGVIAVCAMILPGISGSFILLLLGKYTLVMTAVHTLNFGVLLPFALGALVGLLCFAHLLSWLLHHYANSTLALLAGLMGGTILRIWPWRESSVTAEPHLGFAIVLMVVGACTALILGWMAARRK